MENNNSNNEFQIFTGELGKFRMVTIDGKDYFVAKDIANSLGYSNPRDAISRHCKGVVKHDSFKDGGNMISLIPEGDVYRLVARSKLPEADKFESWIFDDVIPSIRQNGAYVSPDITPQQEEKLDKYSTNKKIKNTFKFCNIESIEAEFKECMIYHKNKDGKEKSGIQNTVINALSDRKQTLIDSGKGSFALVLAEVITAIGKKQLETNNKSKSQIISHRNKVINKQGRLISEQDEIIREQQNQIDFLNPNIEEFTMVKKHPFSTNYMTKTIVDNNGKLKTVTSDEYRNWQNSFPNYAISNENHIDWNSKIYLWLRFDALERFDADNMIKSFQDQLARQYNANDNNVQIREATINKVVKSYGEGKIYYIIRNVD